MSSSSSIHLNAHDPHSTDYVVESTEIDVTTATAGLFSVQFFDGTTGDFATSLSDPQVGTNADGETVYSIKMTRVWADGDLTVSGPAKVAPKLTHPDGPDPLRPPVATLFIRPNFT